LETFVYTLHFLVCFVLIGVVLLQRGKGADLGASLGGGSANTIFGSRGAGNFLTRITTASAIIFMCTSLSLAYLGYQSSDVQLFDTDEPFPVPVEGGLVPTPDEAGGLEEIPTEASGGLVEIPSAEPGAAADAQAADAATNAPPASGDAGEDTP
jgi:preprotein translocase subunit SecG